jgi:hypothetical protein
MKMTNTHGNQVVPSALNSRIVLRSFNGTTCASWSCRPDENYWLLIGQTGTAMETVNAKGRVLVQFDTSVADLGLTCHNPVPNSLFVLETDVEPLS